MHPSRILRAPLLHFLLLGSALWLLSAYAGSQRPLVVPEGQVKALAEDHQRLHGRPPTDAELDRLVDEWATEELMVREAGKLGLHRGDLVIHRRLVEKAALLSGGSGDGGSGDGGSGDGGSGDARSNLDLFELALDLELDRSDSIVRRRLVQRLEQHWLAERGAARAGDPELRAHLEEHADRFRVPERARVRHVFFASATADGDSAERRAQAALEFLRDAEPGAESTVGDPFPHGTDLPLRSERKLAENLGGEAARLAFSAPVGRWVGPVASPWGDHLLYVRERRDARLPDLDVVREQVRRELASERADRWIEEERRALRRSTRVVTAGPGVGS